MLRVSNFLLELTIPKSYRDCVIKSYLDHCQQKGTDSDLAAIIQYSIGGISYRLEKLLFIVAAWALRFKSSLKQRGFFLK